MFFSPFILPELSPLPPPPPRLVLRSVCFCTINASLHLLRWVVGGTLLELRDASLTTSINHSPSDYLCPAPFCVSLNVSVSVLLCLALRDFNIRLVLLSHT